MNDKFFALPQEKQDRILNAGFRVFSKNSYKKSPMLEIANEADISKSLLFFYFKNKKELYLFLMTKAEELTTQYLIDSGCYKETDIFERMYKGLLAKVEMMKKYPEYRKVLKKMTGTTFDNLEQMFRSKWEEDDETLNNGDIVGEDDDGLDEIYND